MSGTARRVSVTDVSPETANAIRSWIRRKHCAGVWTRRDEPKSSGGTREIHAPCNALKVLLRDLNLRHLAPLDTGRYAFCRRGAGVLKAVRQHRAHPALLHRDLTNFFPSVSDVAIGRTLKRRGFSQRSSSDLAAICTLDGRLIQGSPASVTLGNLVLGKLDARIGSLCEQKGLTYTRYVDDLAVSGGRRRLESLQPLIDRIIQDEGYPFGSKGGLFTLDEYCEYLGIAIGRELLVGEKARARALQAYEAMERQEITYEEFLAKTSWIRAVEGPLMPSVLRAS